MVETARGKQEDIKVFKGVPEKQGCEMTSVKRQ